MNCIGLEEVLQLLGVEHPFEKDGSLTDEGCGAVYKLVQIVDGLDYMGVLGLTGDKLEDKIDEIIRLGF